MAGGTMSLDTTLADITARLRHNAFPNERAISQGIILRVLRELGWDTYATNVVWPEYRTGGGRAEFALCHPPSKPAIFFEIYRAAGVVQEAVQYAFHCGVPFVVLTDGRIWSFYLPLEQGGYEERRVYKLDLYERSQSEAAQTLRHYLARENVASGRSLEAARTEYRGVNRRSRAKVAIPEVWRGLLQERNASLIGILVDAVESKVGFAPDADDVAEFLGGTASPKPPDPHSVQPTTPSVLLADRPAPRPGHVVIRGKRYDCGPTAKDAMATVLRELARSNPSLLERCAQHPEARGRRRRYIARTPEELYPPREDDRGRAKLSRWPSNWRNQYEKLPGGWLVATHLSNDDKRKIVALAAKTAGLKPDEDITLPF